MYKKILSILLSFIIFLSLPLCVSASDSEHGGSSGSIEEEYPYIPLTDEINDEFYVFFNYLGAFLSPGVSPRDVLKQYCINQDGYTSDYFRWNDETKEVEVRSNFLHDSTDGITLPSEKAQILKQIIQEYSQTKSNDSAYLEYTPVEQNGQTFIPKLYVTSYGSSASEIYTVHDRRVFNVPSFGMSFTPVTVDTSEYRCFAILSDDYTIGKELTFYTTQLNNPTSSKNLYIPFAIQIYNVGNGSVRATDKGRVFNVGRCISWSSNFPIFSSFEDAYNWVSSNDNSLCVNNTFNNNYYLSQKFNQSVDNSVTITNEMLTQNFQEINNNYYNNVYNYVSNYVTENDSNPDSSALQAKIDEMQSSLDQILEELKNSSGGGSGEGGSGEGGSSSGDSAIDYSKDLEEIKTSLSDIYKKLEEFYEKYKNTVDSETQIDLSNIEKSLSDLDKLLTDFSQDNLQALQDMYKRLDDILTQLKNAPDQVDYSTNFDNLEQILADIQLLLTSDSELYHSSLSHIEELLEENNKQNKNFFDKVLDKFDDIITYLKKIYRVNVVDTIADIVSSITDLFDFASLAQRSSETANLVKTKFPFCMPFDLFATLGVLSAPAVIPHFELPFNFNIFGTQTENTISIDLTQYEKLATFSRDAFTVLFVVGLIMLTIKVFHGGDNYD